MAFPRFGQSKMAMAHAQKVRLIVKTRRKDDRLDARTLARLARIDPQLLTPVQHRSAQAQLHLAEIRTGEHSNGPGECRRRIGEVLRRTAAQVITGGLSPGLREALEPLWREVESLSEGIKEYDRWIEKMAKERQRRLG